MMATMRCLFVALLALAFLPACESSGSGGEDGETGDGCEAPLADGCECDPGDDQCADGLTCSDEGVCGCPDPDGLGCPCAGPDDCGGGLECTENTCTATCGPEIDFMTDVENCGECGNACPDADGSCQDGVCFGPAAFAECFVPGGDVSCVDVCNDLGDGSVCVDACPSGWVGYSSPGCVDPEAEGSCTDLIDQPFASTACCCATPA